MKVAAPILVASFAAAASSSAWASAAPQHGGERALLIVDPSHADALQVANAYVEARTLPLGNVLCMDPDTSSYVQLVDGPMRGMLGEIQQRQLSPSVDFVIVAPSDEFRVSASGLLSDQCASVNHFGVASALGMYGYANDLLPTSTFSAPSLPNPFWGQGWFGRSFRGADSWWNGSVVDPTMGLSRRQLVPARLGWTGSLGNTAQEVIDMIARSVAADGTEPGGTVYYMQTTDAARSAPRHGLYPEAVTRVAAAGGSAEHLFDVLPLGRNDAIGIMTGAATPAIDGGGYTLLPGSFADHLTSFAGHFGTTSQTKMSRWIAAGASGTSGAIEEPCNYAQKFPHPKVHTAYRRGVTLGEAWFRSRQAAPLQSMFLGDPLTQPWHRGPTVDVPDAPQGPVQGVIALTPTSAPNASTGNPVAAYELFVDGVLADRVGATEAFAVDASAYAAGPHSLLVRAEDSSLARFVGVWSGSLEVAGGVSVSLGGPAAAVDLGDLFTVTVAAQGGIAEGTVLRHLGRVVGASEGPSGQIEVAGRVLGAGVARLVAETRFQDGRRAVSAPLLVTVNNQNGAAAPAAPIAFGYRRALATLDPFVLDLPAAFGDALGAATFEIVTAPAQAAQIGGGFSAPIFEPAPGAAGVDLVQFRVTTPAGSSEVATVQLVYPAAVGTDPPRLFCRPAANSAGPGARLGWTGTTSLAADDLILSAAGLPTQSFGVFFRSDAIGEAPLGNGFLCAVGMQVRLGIVQADTAGLLSWNIQPSTQPGTAVVAGSTWHFQLWHRDSVGAGFGVTDGLRVTFVP